MSPQRTHRNREEQKEKEKDRHAEYLANIPVPLTENMNS